MSGSNEGCYHWSSYGKLGKTWPPPFGLRWTAPSDGYWVFGLEKCQRATTSWHFTGDSLSKSTPGLRPVCRVSRMSFQRSERRNLLHRRGRMERRKCFRYPISTLLEVQRERASGIFTWELAINDQFERCPCTCRALKAYGQRRTGRTEPFGAAWRTCRDRPRNHVVEVDGARDRYATPGIWERLPDTAVQRVHRVRLWTISLLSGSWKHGNSLCQLRCCGAAPLTWIALASVARLLRPMTYGL